MVYIVLKITPIFKISARFNKLKALDKVYWRLRVTQYPICLGVCLHDYQGTLSSSYLTDSNHLNNARWCHRWPRDDPLLNMPTQALRLEDAASWHGCVLAYGHFNTIHPGHIRYLRHARGLGDKLVVALIGDGKANYAFQQQERAEALSLLGIADALLLLEADELNEAIESTETRGPGTGQ